MATCASRLRPWPAPTVFQDAGAKVFGISSDSPDANAGFAKAQRLPFPLLTDQVRRPAQRMHARLAGAPTPALAWAVASQMCAAPRIVFRLQSSVGAHQLLGQCGQGLRAFDGGDEAEGALLGRRAISSGKTSASSPTCSACSQVSDQLKG